MAGYASQQREPSTRGYSPRARRLQLAPIPAGTEARSVPPCTERAATKKDAIGFEPAIIEQLVDRIAERLAATIAEKLAVSNDREDEWFDSSHAAEYLGLHRDTLRKLAAERAIPSEQDGPGCKLYFRRSDLDMWRRGGGRPRHLASALLAVA